MGACVCVCILQAVGGMDVRADRKAGVQATSLRRRSIVRSRPATVAGADAVAGDGAGAQPRGCTGLCVVAGTLTGWN